ncbi:MAG: hypothetical protein QG657_1893 [Acidobacteriota bacterium]|nr:hypothetical protein [Acidobacteriota bacterium]
MDSDCCFKCPRRQGILLLIPQKSVQKKQGFEILSSEKEGPGAVQGGLGRRPILKKGSLTSQNFC